MSYGDDNGKDQIARVTHCNLSKSQLDPGSVLEQRVCCYTLTDRIQSYCEFGDKT